MKSNWTTVRLGDMCEIKNGYAFKSKDFASSGVPVIKIKNVKPNQIIESDFSYIPENIAEKRKKWLIHQGDILLTMTGNRADGSPESWVGKAALFTLEGKYLLNQRVAAITSNHKELDTEYLGYYLSSWESQLYFIKRANSSGGQANISPNIVRDYIIALPPLEEQVKIVEILKTIDARIKNNCDINDNLQQQAKSLYEEMFLNNPDADMVSGTLSDIATITMGQSPSGSSYNEESVGEIFYQGRAEFGFRFPTRRLFTTEPKRMAEPGDVLLSVRAPVGDLNVAYEKCCIGRGLGAIHSKTGDSSFMLYTMFALKPQLDVFNGEGTVFGSINRDGLSNLPVNIPSAEEIAKFEATVRPMDNLIRTNYEEICRLQSIRDSLLPKLMSGEIDVSDIQL